MSFNINLKFEKYCVRKELNLLLVLAVILDPMYKLKYLDVCHKKISEPEEVSKVMIWVESDLPKLFQEYVTNTSLLALKSLLAIVKLGADTSSSSLQEKVDVAFKLCKERIAFYVFNAFSNIFKEPL